MSTNYRHGQIAEASAANHLANNGFKVVEQNWKTQRCEIDIIAKKKHVVYFFEVKYRKNQNQGTGLDYITPKKLHQMQYAARAWISFNDWEYDARLGAIEVSGDDYCITNVIEDIEF